jgi:CPA1 family monovalent cation:H+ antiporter
MFQIAESNLINLEVLAVFMLAIASLVGIFTRRLRMPYTVGLVLVGLALSLLPQLGVEVDPEPLQLLEDFVLTPELILGLLVPPLIFEAAFHLKFGALRRNLAPILSFAIPGVILTTFLVGGVVAWGTGIDFTAAILFGSLVAATDPVAVIALFRSIGVPKRLQVILEGESLLNDGTAIVLFTLASEVVVTGEFSLPTSIIEFIRVAGGGIAVGLGLGFLISLVFRRIDDALIETTLTLVTAYGAYLIAESVHVSGVLGVVAAGLITGNISPQRMSPSSRILVFNFWEIAAFLANSIIFLVIGLQIDLNDVILNWQAMVVAILAVLAARAVVIFGLSWTGKDIPRNWNPVLYWGGLRGAISLALALSLPSALGAARGQLESMAFGVVLFTLLVQGTTMGPLVRRMDLIRRTEIQEIYEIRHARVIAARAALARVREMHEEGIISDHIWGNLSLALQKHRDALVSSVSELLTANPQVEEEELETARKESLRSQRSVITELLTDGLITEETFTLLAGELDVAIEDPTRPWSNLLIPALAKTRSINGLLAAVVHARDASRVMDPLKRQGFTSIQLPSAGGFLGRRNATILIGIGEGEEGQVVEILKKHCRRRVEFILNPLEGWQIPIATPRRVKVGGATIFVLEVEDYREF